MTAQMYLALLVAGVFSDDGVNLTGIRSFILSGFWLMGQ